ncbi:MAG TPA: hypothetical protein VFJ81_12930 [Gemmatimonadales bacterium]|nr:hypothetical protein [Gemmatimonadales bacterium]
MTPAPGYSRGERHHMHALLRRAAHLSARLSGQVGAPDPAASYDRLELAGLRWAVDRLVRESGPLPPELDELHAAAWPRLPAESPAT